MDIIRSINIAPYYWPAGRSMKSIDCRATQGRYKQTKKKNTNKQQWIWCVTSIDFWCRAIINWLLICFFFIRLFCLYFAFVFSRSRREINKHSVRKADKHDAYNSVNVHMVSRDWFFFYIHFIWFLFTAPRNFFGFIWMNILPIRNGGKNRIESNRTADKLHKHENWTIKISFKKMGMRYIYTVAEHRK